MAAGAARCAPTVWVAKDKRELRQNATELTQIFAEVQKAGGDDDALPHPLQDITDLELEEIRQLKHPPEPVRRIMECVHLILFETGIPLDGIKWPIVVRSLVQTNYLRKVRRYEISELAEKPRIVDHICRFYFNRSCVDMRLDRIRRASSAVVAFFGWTVALLAGVLPTWPTEEVAGEESRKVVAELEAERRVFVRQEVERKEAERLEQQRVENERQEAKRREAAEREARAEAVARAEALRLEELAREEAAREEVARRAALEREAEEERKLVALREAKTKDEEMLRDLEAARYMELCVWNTAKNPDRRLLQVDGNVVSFPSDAMANFCNVLTDEGLTEGVVYYEFVMHHIGDEQWVGLTTDPAQGGMRISGWNVRAWTYYCGRRWEHPQAHREGVPGLMVNKKWVQSFARVVSGDIVGVVVDAGRRAAAFLLNGELQGACLLDQTTRPIYAIIHLDAAGDRVELRAHGPTHAPKAALRAIDALLGDEA